MRVEGSRNYFENLDIAINAQGVNRYDDGWAIDPGSNEDGPPANYTGLVLKCNIYHDNSFDEVITRENPTGTEGIARDQGNPSPSSDQDLAGNLFSPYHETSAIPESDIYNEGNHMAYYHHIQQYGQDKPRTRPDFHTPVLVQPDQIQIDFDTLTCCPSRLSSGSSEEELAENMAAEADSTEALSAEYTALVDGGDTEEMNEEILFSIPQEALSLQQQLLGESPYLSDTVMQSAVAKEEVLPNAMIRDILVANPQSAKSTRVMEELGNRFVPMPEPMMEEILEGQTTISDKEVLEGRIAWHHATRTQLFYERMRRYKADTLNPEASFSNLVALLQQESTLPSRYQLAFEYLAKGDTTLALSTLDAIPSAFTLSAGQQTEYEGYQDLMDLYIDLHREGKSILELSSQQVATLETLTATQSEPLSALARNALRANGTLDYYEPILLPDLTKSAPQKPETKTGKINTTSYFTLFPNPANDYLILEYSIPGAENSGNQAIFVITSAEGKQIKTITVHPGQNQLLVPITGLKAGQYLCTLKQQGNPLQSEKFIIIR